MLEVMWSHKFSHSQDWLPLLVWLGAESCWHMLGLLTAPSGSMEALFPQALDVGLHVESEAMWEDEWWHNITILWPPPNSMMWNEWFSSVLAHIVGTELANHCSVSSSPDSGRNLSHLKKNKACLDRGHTWVSLKALQYAYYCILSWLVIRNLALSHLVWGILKFFMHYLPDQKHYHFSGYGPNWLSGITVNHGLDLANELGIFLSEKPERSFQPAIPL